MHGSVVGESDVCGVTNDINLENEHEDQPWQQVLGWQVASSKENPVDDHGHNRHRTCKYVVLITNQDHDGKEHGCVNQSQQDDLDDNAKKRRCSAVI